MSKYYCVGKSDIPYVLYKICKDEETAKIWCKYHKSEYNSWDFDINEVEIDEQPPYPSSDSSSDSHICYCVGKSDIPYVLFRICKYKKSAELWCGHYDLVNPNDMENYRIYEVEINKQTPEEAEEAIKVLHKSSSESSSELLDDLV